MEPLLDDLLPNNLDTGERAWSTCHKRELKGAGGDGATGDHEGREGASPIGANAKWREEHERRDDAHDTSEENLQSGNLLFNVYFTCFWLKDYFIA